MNIKQLIKTEDKAQEVWVVSPSLHYDTHSDAFTELVSVNLGQKTKYRYIVPATKEVEKNLVAYKKTYQLTQEEMNNNFLLLPESEFNPFILEVAIYDGSTEPQACSAPAVSDGDVVIQFSKETSQKMADSFKTIWKRYKRSNP
ncbi:MAG TPA: hypothetical protein PKD85_20585 [Saprospiraceae bacterium]|nr:hypothetical protein [Saprospiraceae bacterium]